MTACVESLANGLHRPDAIHAICADGTTHRPSTVEQASPQHRHNRFCSLDARRLIAVGFRTNRSTGIQASADASIDKRALQVHPVDRIQSTAYLEHPDGASAPRTRPIG
jgi:hypothetical protein